MKEIIAIIRPKKVSATKNALEKLGFPSVTAIAVLGRGRQRGIASEINMEFPAEIFDASKTISMKYIPKRQLSIVVPDQVVPSVIAAIIAVNQTSQIGDGKIFVCPVERVVRVRTDEENEAAIL
jgi:nitrogen regulatory protein PII 2